MDTKICFFEERSGVLKHLKMTAPNHGPESKIFGHQSRFVILGALFVQLWTLEFDISDFRKIVSSQNRQRVKMNLKKTFFLVTLREIDEERTSVGGMKAREKFF